MTDDGKPIRVSRVPEIAEVARHTASSIAEEFRRRQREDNESIRLVSDIAEARRKYVDDGCRDPVHLKSLAARVWGISKENTK